MLSDGAVVAQKTFIWLLLRDGVEYRIKHFQFHLQFWKTDIWKVFHRNFWFYSKFLHPHPFLFRQIKAYEFDFDYYVSFQIQKRPCGLFAVFIPIAFWSSPGALFQRYDHIQNQVLFCICYTTNVTFRVILVCFLTMFYFLSVLLQGFFNI